MHTVWRVVAGALLSAICACAASNFPEDPLKNPGFVYFYNLEYTQAIDTFAREVKDDPSNPRTYNHLAQAILYREMFRNGALESQLVTGSNPFLRQPKMRISAEDRSRFFDCINRSLALTQATLATNANDVPALYSNGAAHALRATFLFLVEKAWVDSLKDASADRNASHRILEADPKFIDAHFALGLYDYVVGNLSFFMRALSFVGGFRGDKAGGIRQIEEVNRSGIGARYDAQILLAVIYRRERRPLDAMPLLKNLAETFPRNYLFRFEQVQMYSDLGDKNAALRVIGEIEDLRRTKAPGYADLAQERVAFLRGNLLFWYRDFPAALQDLKTVALHPDRVPFSTAVLAQLRVGQLYDIMGDRDRAVVAYRSTIDMASGSEIAAEARSYIEKPYRRKDFPSDGR